MAGPKKQVMAPIDRPLSRAYLRQFTGWSTAYPPGISEPTSLRLMENVMVNRDGAVQVRPGLRYLSFAGTNQPVTVYGKPVGSHEAFFLADGSKAYLFAIREADGTVGFRVLRPTALGNLIDTLTQAGFTLPAIPAQLNFTAATTYVKYLQIDNKIFALSNAGESMRLFYVGAEKRAKLLSAITEPGWNAEDKLTVAQPEAAWITSGVPTSVRTNLLANPSAETGIANWTVDPANTIISRSNAVGAQAGSYVLRVESKPERRNAMPYALRGPVSSLGGWTPGGGADSFSTFTANVGYAQLIVAKAVGGIVYANGPTMSIEGGQAYEVAMDIVTGQGGVGSAVPDTWLLARFYAGNGSQIGGDQTAQLTAGAFGALPNTRLSKLFSAPAGAVYMNIFPYAVSRSASGQGVFQFRNVNVCKNGESSAHFDGASGGNYFWEGAPGASASVFHPPKDVAFYSDAMPVTALTDYTASVYVRAGTTVRQVQIAHLWYTAAGVANGSDATVAANDTTGWTRVSKTSQPPSVDQTPNPPKVTTQARLWISFKAVPRGEYHYVDAGLYEKASSAGVYFDGATDSTAALMHAWSGAAHGSASSETTLSAPIAPPASETPTANTLISTGTNGFNFGFFYCFYNEVGDSAHSQVTVVRASRAWSQWRWETANPAGEPSGTATNDPLLCADQLVATVPQASFDQALAQGAIGWKLYMLTWSDQDPVPVTAVKVAERKLNGLSLYASNGWLQATPQQIDSSGETSGLPNETTRYNYSAPSHGGQGLVAADRMIMVNDPAAAAVIRWSSNQQGEYTNFSANKGGGYKTLTSGNLYVPACVKLWQNPQSADTLTILCMGVDGYSTGYYMAPSQIASQSEATNIMGFEETTATPGTVSPYGVEVLNNALYHPLDDQLMKSTATNYNINHASVTDAIQPTWRALRDKHHIVSSYHDNRLYYLVHNPAGAPLEAGCWGNEVWVFDAAQKAGSWSRWLVQGQSLRKIEVGGQVQMSLTRPDGIFYFDELYALDDYVDGTIVKQRPIAWLIETNTQGANRAHDAWCHLQQADIQVGNFTGQLRYGVRGRDVHGKVVDISKVTTDTNPAGDLPWDLEDFLLIRRDMKEWFFYAGSHVDDEGAVQPSSGQINLVQYRYTPVSVNTGYEFGSVETFEYGRSPVDPTHTNGVPMPYVDTARP